MIVIEFWRILSEQERQVAPGKSLSLKIKRAGAPALGWLAAVVSAIAALNGGPSAAADEAEPVVVEMFVSQSCKLSPPAAAYAAELARRTDLVVLTFHIDYWNVLTSRKNGRWRDPYGAADFAGRQRDYNRSIRGRGTVFTPQAIVSGAASEVGSKRDSIERFIELERREKREARTSIRREGDRISVIVDPSGNKPRDVFVVRFMPWASTPISGGDNAGTVFDEPNVVRALEKIGSVTHRTETFSFDRPPQGEGCAVLVQEENRGRIVGARYCP